MHTLRTIDDALALAPLLQPGRHVVVVGGGWIGLEVAATARKKGADVVVVEAQSRLCERTVPAEISEHLLALHRTHGTRVMLGAGVAGFAPLTIGPLGGHARPTAACWPAMRSSSASAWCRTTNWRATPGWPATAA